ncbi:MAG TPA: hypothetical protein DEX10_10275 [Betaproteobacteria bacterium]|nr:hypothetical protein [Betaproteobacteria bacterium]
MFSLRAKGMLLIRLFGMSVAAKRMSLLQTYQIHRAYTVVPARGLRPQKVNILFTVRAIVW